MRATWRTASARPCTSTSPRWATRPAPPASAARCGSTTSAGPGWRAVGWLDPAGPLLGIAYGYTGGPGPVVVRGGPPRPARRADRDDRRLLRADRAARAARTRRAADSARGCCGPCWRVPIAGTCCCRPPSTARARPDGRGGSTAAWASATCCATTCSPATPARSPCSAATLPAPPPAPAPGRAGRPSAPVRGRTGRTRPGADGTMAPCRGTMAPSPSPPSVRRALTLALALLVAFTALSGCARVRAALAVQPDDTVNGEIVVATPETGPDDPGPAITVPEEISDDVDVSAYRQEGYTGSLLRFSGLTFDQLGRLSAAAGPAGREGPVRAAPGRQPADRQRQGRPDHGAGRPGRLPAQDHHVRRGAGDQRRRRRRARRAGRSTRARSATSAPSSRPTTRTPRPP